MPQSKAGQRNTRGDRAKKNPLAFSPARSPNQAFALDSVLPRAHKLIPRLATASKVAPLPAPRSTCMSHAWCLHCVSSKHSIHLVLAAHPFCVLHWQQQPSFPCAHPKPASVHCRPVTAASKPTPWLPSRRLLSSGFSGQASVLLGLQVPFFVCPNCDLTLALDFAVALFGWILLLAGVSALQQNCDTRGHNALVLGGVAGYLGSVSCSRFYGYTW